MKLTKHIRYFFLTAFVLQLTTLNAQTYTFLKNDGTVVKTKDSADYVRLVGNEDAASKLFPVTDYYISGKIKARGFSSIATGGKFEGARISYFESGKKQSSINYAKNQVIGTAYFFHPNGNIYYAGVPDSVKQAPMNLDLLVVTAKDSTGVETVTNGTGYFIKYSENFDHIQRAGNLVSSRWHGEVKGNLPDRKGTFVENYEYGKLTTGISTDVNGQKFNYSAVSEQPVFKGGMEAFRRYLAYTIKYPKEGAAVSGKIVTTFVVNIDGSLSDAVTTEGLYPEIDAVVRAVILKSPKWTPGLRNGMPAKFKFSVPVNVQLSGIR